jgi:hypothetical protein
MASKPISIGLPPPAEAASTGGIGAGRDGGAVETGAGGGASIAGSTQPGVDGCPMAPAAAATAAAPHTAEAAAPPLKTLNIAHGSICAGARGAAAPTAVEAKTSDPAAAMPMTCLHPVIQFFPDATARTPPKVVTQLTRNDGPVPLGRD